MEDKNSDGQPEIVNSIEFRTYLDRSQFFTQINPTFSPCIIFDNFDGIFVQMKILFCVKEASDYTTT